MIPERGTIAQRLFKPLREPRRLLGDFIAEHLDGDIGRLAGYDLRQLKDVPRFGDTHGYAFDPYRTDLVKAIAVLAFRDIAPREVMFDRKRGMLALMPAPLIREDLWGTQIGDEFVMLTFFHHEDKASVHRRIQPCAALCNTIGNLYLHPYSLDEYRHSHAHGRFLVDHTFADLHKALTGGTASRKMREAVACAGGFFAQYQGEEGWIRLMQRWLTMGLVDYFYNPEPIFDDITFTTHMPTSLYYRAVERCMAICREVIPARAVEMVARLREVGL